MAEMKSRQRVASRNPGQPDQPRLRWKTKALLLATAVVIGATIYVVAWDPLKPKTKLPARDTGPTTGERVRQNMEGLIAQADAIDPRGGQGNLVTRQVAYERAAELGKQFVRLADRRDVLVRPVLAMALLRLGRLDEADKTLADLMALAPRSAEGMCLKAEVIEARGGQGALELFRRAAESDQATPEMWARYGTALLAAEQYDRGEAMLGKALRAENRDHQVLWGLAMLAMRAGKYDQAEPRLAEMASRPRPSMRVLVMLAECQKENGKLAESEKTLRRALARTDVPELYIPLGDVLQLQRKYPEAAETFAKAAEISSRQAVASFKAARVYYLLDRYGLAMKYIDRAAALVADPEVRQWQRKIEDARFGAPGAKMAPRLQLPPPSTVLGPAPGSDANTAPPTTRPTGGLLDFK